jgi:antitoxin VapB
MSFYIKDPATDEIVRKLAKLKGKTLTETVRDAVERAYEGQTRTSLRERVAPILRHIQSYPDSGLKVDKAFYDELSGED